MLVDRSHCFQVKSSVVNAGAVNCYRVFNFAYVFILCSALAGQVKGTFLLKPVTVFMVIRFRLYEPRALLLAFVFGL